jgi:hypothetical protein
MAWALASCVSVTWERHTRNEPLSEQALSGIRVDDSDLAEVLAACGAPLRVWELPAGEMAVAYGWYRERQLGAQVSVPLFDRFSGSVSFDDFDTDLVGVVMGFDADRRLRSLRRGFLRELVAEPARRRASLVDDGERSVSQSERRSSGSSGPGSTAAR